MITLNLVPYHRQAFTTMPALMDIAQAVAGSINQLAIGPVFMMNPKKWWTHGVDVFCHKHVSCYEPPDIFKSDARCRQKLKS